MGKNTIGTLEKSLSITEIISQYDGARLQTIAEEMDSTPATVYSHVNTLKLRGYVEQHGQEYNLSSKLVGVGLQQANLNYVNLYADTYTKRVADETGCRALFAVEANNVGVSISRDAGQYSKWPSEDFGREFYFHTTAAGKVILASKGERAVEEIVADVGLPAETEHSITSKTELRAELATVRSSGVAFNVEESQPDIISAAVPVEAGEFVGALVTTAPIFDVNEDWFRDEMPPTLNEIAADYEAELGDVLD
jgi:DNA-binding IclR family transcriptional regulator